MEYKITAETCQAWISLHLAHYIRSPSNRAIDRIDIWRRRLAYVEEFGAYAPGKGGPDERKEQVHERAA